MSEQFTPGPWISKRDGKFLDSDGWIADNDKYGSVASVPIKAGRKVIALVVDGSDSWDAELAELRGNAALLTAAPELYASLREILALYKGKKPHLGDALEPVIKAKAVLAKAIGEQPEPPRQSRREISLARARGELPAT